MKDSVLLTSFAVVATLSLAGCSSSNGPGDQLVGKWATSSAYLSAVSDSVVFSEPCATAVFAPITLDASNSFSALSTSYSEVGNARHTPGDELHLQGTLSGNQLMLTFFVVHLVPPANDPVSVTLPHVSQLPTFVCLG
jgi:hypothetical protein